MLRREESRGRLQDVVRTPQLADLALELGQPLRFAGRVARPDTAVDLGLTTQLRNVTGCMPSCSATRAIAPGFVAGSARSSTAIRVARSRSSSGYFLGGAMTLILHGLSFHQTRGDSQSSKTVIRSVKARGSRPASYCHSALHFETATARNDAPRSRNSPSDKRCPRVRRTDERSACCRRRCGGTAIWPPPAPEGPPWTGGES